MVQIITPNGKVGWLRWEFLAKCIAAKDKIVLNAIDQMIGFAVSEPENKNYFVGDLTDDRKLQYFYGGAYETLSIPKYSVIVYSKAELIGMFCEQYEKVTHNTLSLTAK